MEGGEEKPLVIVLHGPSGVGKDSVIDRLRERLGIHRATSSTTRPPRGNEVDGIHYHFLSEAEFRQKIAAGEFAEWANVYGDLKGVERQDVIIRTDVQGARTWRRKLEGAIFIFLTAEDREVLRARLIARGTEDPEQLTARLAELEEELADLPNNDYVVINRDGRLEEAVDEIAEIIQREKRNPHRPRARLVA
ncbi:MAG: guanylate kinase [Chloroflexota bacterium]